MVSCGWPNMELQSAYDLVDPRDPQKRTWRQMNQELKHNIPLGSLVEIVKTGVRLFVVFHGRDCDGTPLYWLSYDKEKYDKNDLLQSLKSTGGYSENSLKLV